MRNRREGRPSASANSRGSGDSNVSGAPETGWTSVSECACSSSRGAALAAALLEHAFLTPGSISPPAALID